MNYVSFSDKFIPPYNNRKRGSSEPQSKERFLTCRRKISIGPKGIEGMLYYGNGTWYQINHKWRRTRCKYHRKVGFQIDYSWGFVQLFNLEVSRNRAKLSQLNDITDIFDKEPHHQVACLLINAGRALKNTGLQFKGVLGLKNGKSKYKARDSCIVMMFFDPLRPSWSSSVDESLLKPWKKYMIVKDGHLLIYSSDELTVLTILWNNTSFESKLMCEFEI